jgi:hypothetical protein
MGVGCDKNGSSQDFEKLLDGQPHPHEPQNGKIKQLISNFSKLSQMK